MAGFQLTLHGRIWVTAEALKKLVREQSDYPFIEERKRALGEAQKSIPKQN